MQITPNLHCISSGNYRVFSHTTGHLITNLDSLTASHHTPAKCIVCNWWGKSLTKEVVCPLSFLFVLAEISKHWICCLGPQDRIRVENGKDTPSVSDLCTFMEEGNKLISHPCLCLGIPYLHKVISLSVKSF